MINSIKIKVDIFYNYYSSKIETIKSLDYDAEKEIFKKILLVTIIDACSKCIYPDKKNQTRYISFLENFADWKESKKICITHLRRFIELIPKNNYINLYNYVFKKCSKWIPGQMKYITDDPDYGEVHKLWPPGNYFGDQFNKIKLDNFKHSTLFYLNRNCMVHELINKDAYDIWKDGSTPYYHHVSSYPENPKINLWILVYPLDFYYDLTIAGLENAKTYLLNNDIDPIKILSIGDYWIDALNR